MSQQENEISTLSASKPKSTSITRFLSSLLLSTADLLDSYDGTGSLNSIGKMLIYYAEHMRSTMTSDMRFQGLVKIVSDVVYFIGTLLQSEFLVTYHHFKWWLGGRPIRALLLTATKGAVPSAKDSTYCL